MSDDGAARRAADPATPVGGRRKAQRMAAAAAYLGVGRHLPWSPRPGGGLARRARALSARWMLDECGADVNIEHGAWFGSGKGVRVGDRSDIGMDALVIGPVHIGADVMMGPRCVLLASAHETRSVDVPMNQQGFREDRPIVIEDDVWIGAGCIILPGRRIGTGSIVGAGSVVVSDVPPWTVVAGNPARIVKKRRTGDQLPEAVQASVPPPVLDAAELDAHARS
ncbi:DapH/DapD/GlmU-related protein [Kineococcus endophyticus]|uniref:DapH/DapD/GlmU-related protein n=1 Tax=Kineococcus endophyticus TaxID=1181883 RepID=A0ABV3P8S5_9ACTN